jgi:hypothetical protein
MMDVDVVLVLVVVVVGGGGGGENKLDIVVSILDHFCIALISFIV